MAEPKDKNSYEWLEWYVRRNVIGAYAVSHIQESSEEDLEKLKEFIDATLKKRKK